MKTKAITLMAGILLLSGLILQANNINVTNISLTGQNTTAGENNAANYSLVKFDLSWENSWRVSTDPNNWDAAWVFVKYSTDSKTWHHAFLNNSGHTAPSVATVQAGLVNEKTAFDATTNPAVGAFVYRREIGQGDFSPTGIQLRWNYGANGVNDGAFVDIRVFAVEMVYVPEGAFYAGSGGTEEYAFYKYPKTTNPYQITSENAITVGTSDGNLYYQISTWGGDNSGPIPTAFPKGFAGFYMQKYELSQQAYVDFLNTLSREQQNSRTATSLPSGTTSVTNRYVMSGTSPVSQRNGIRCDAKIAANESINFYCDLNGNGIGGETNDGQGIACNFLSWDDGTAWADWAGLRPFTELEYEKACRGTSTPVANEYAWGTAEIASDKYTLSNAGAANEGIATDYNTSETVGNACYSSTDGSNVGPLRGGIFAANTNNTGRVTSGASYYGIMELTGNLLERPVTVSNPEGRAFTGLHGNGSLIGASHDVTNWPEGSNQIGAGFRGGDLGWGDLRAQVSDRHNAVYYNYERRFGYGFRVSRGMPSSQGE